LLLPFKNQRRYITKIQEKMKAAFDQLEEVMKAQQHLDEGKIDEVLALTAQCSKFWRVLDDEPVTF
jgi:hypothetical protein